MKEVLADTFYFLALANQDDGAHGAAVEASRDSTLRYVIHPWVLAEIGNALAKPAYRRQFVELVDLLQDDPRAILLPATQDLFIKGLHLYRGRPDQEWSLTDCISFAVMRERGIREALTADHHFLQAGFTLLLK